MFATIQLLMNRKSYVGYNLSVVVESSWMTVSRSQA